MLKVGFNVSTSVFLHQLPETATAVADRVWADTLMSAEGQRPGTRAEMFDRTASLLTLLTDRQTWPHR
jgi:hypothetical protein